MAEDSRVCARYMHLILTRLLVICSYNQQVYLPSIHNIFIDLSGLIVK
jgi:general stress protein CsbA